MDFQNTLQLLAKSLELLGLCFPKSCTISQNGPEVNLNINFRNTSMKTDFETSTTNCESVYQRKKSPSTIKRDKNCRQLFLNKIKTAENPTFDTSHLTPGGNQLNADAPAFLPGCSGSRSRSSQQHLEATEPHSNPDNMEKPQTDFETIGFDDEISEELYEADTTSVLPFYDCDTKDIFDVINPVDSILDDLKQTKCKLQILNKQLKDKSCSSDMFPVKSQIHLSQQYKRL